MPRESDATKISPKTDALVGAAGTKDVQNGLANAQLHFTKYRHAFIIFPIFLNFILILSIFSTAYRPGDTTKFTSLKHPKSKCAPGHYVYGVFGNNGTVICNKLIESNFIDVACPSNKYVEAVFTSNHTLRCAPLPESPIRTYNNHYNTTITKVLITANSTEGQELDFSTAPSASAPSGGIKIASGKSTGGRGGDIMIAVGDGDTGVGGDINIKAGKTLADDGTTGGMLVLHAGESTLTSSGKVSIATPNAGSTGVSGTIDIVSGTSSAGGSGSISLTTGKSTGGKGGTITLSVGDGDTGVGGDININAGKTSASNTQGGAVTISSGASTQGASGDIVLSVGTSTTNNNGKVKIQGVLNVNGADSLNTIAGLSCSAGQILKMGSSSLWECSADGRRRLEEMKNVGQRINIKIIENIQKEIQGLKTRNDVLIRENLSIRYNISLIFYLFVLFVMFILVALMHLLTKVHK